MKISLIVWPYYCCSDPDAPGGKPVMQQPQVEHGIYCISFEYYNLSSFLIVMVLSVFFFPLNL
jgi:hypothetical protein